MKVNQLDPDRFILLLGCSRLNREFSDRWETRLVFSIGKAEGLGHRSFGVAGAFHAGTNYISRDDCGWPEINGEIHR